MRKRPVRARCPDARMGFRLPERSKHPAGRTSDLGRDHRFRLVKSCPHGYCLWLARAVSLAVAERGGLWMTTLVREGDLLWTPSAEQIAGANLTAFTAWLARERGRSFDDYHALWRWSVEDLEGFWQAVWDYCGVDASAAPDRVLGRRTMPGAEWFPGARLNYAQHVLRRERPGEAALLSLGETRPAAVLDWADLAGQVRILATWLRGTGVRPGDRVASYLPNIPQTVVAMLATTSIGAIWAGCSPDFGWRGVLDRFQQLRPKVLFCVDGYAYGGATFDRRDELRQIVRGLDELQHVVCVPFLNQADGADGAAGAGARGGLSWDARARDAGCGTHGRGTHGRATWCPGTRCSIIPRCPPRNSPSSRSRSATRCGSCSPPARPGCPRRSCTATAGSCWSN